MSRRYLKAFSVLFMLLVSAMAIVAIIYKVRIWPAITIDDMYFYYYAGATNAPLSQFFNDAVLNTPLVVGLFAILSLPVFPWFKRRLIIRPRVAWLPTEIAFPPTLRCWSGRFKYVIVTLLVAVLGLAASFHAGGYVVSLVRTSTLFDDNYVDAGAVQLTFPQPKRNLVYIYLESMENTVASKANGGAADVSRIPELEALALHPDTITFSNTSHPLGGTPKIDYITYSVAGLIAQNGGIPFYANAVAGATHSTQERYLPGLTMLGDILHDQGYHQTILMGAKASFAGVDKQFKQHGNYHIIDHDYAQMTGLIPPNYHVWWGYEDSKLFKFARDEATRLADTGRPFNLQVFTADTHFQDGFLDPSCGRPFLHPYDDAHACSSKMATQFVSWVQQQPWGDNTTIIVTGDHLGMQAGYYEKFVDDTPGYDRTTYLAILNSAIKPEADRIRNRVYTGMDQFPTTLAAMGVGIPGDRLGLGTSLFAARPTLPEELGGIAAIEDQLHRRNQFYIDVIQNGVKN